MGLNKDNIRAVIRALESLEGQHYFHMGKWFYNDIADINHPCGTPACVAGFTVATCDDKYNVALELYERKLAEWKTPETEMFEVEFETSYLEDPPEFEGTYHDVAEYDGDHGVVFSNAKRLLGLSHPQARSAFLPDRFFDGYGESDISREHAVAMMKHLLETGEVDWRATDPKHTA